MEHKSSKTFPLNIAFVKLKNKIKNQATTPAALQSSLKRVRVKNMCIHLFYF